MRMQRDCQWKLKKSNLIISRPRKPGEIKTKPKKRFLRKLKNSYQRYIIVSNNIIKNKMNIIENTMGSNPIPVIIKNSIHSIIIHLNMCKIHNSIKNSNNKCISINSLRVRNIIISNSNNKMNKVTSSKILITIILIINIDYNTRI